MSDPQAQRELRPPKKNGELKKLSSVGFVDLCHRDDSPLNLDHAYLHAGFNKRTVTNDIERTARKFGPACRA